MIALSLQITLEEPLLATALGGDPNSATSYPFIPGSCIRGNLATRYAQQNNLTDLAGEDTARRLFFTGVIRYLNAYPVDCDGDRTLPVPLSWMVEKGSEAPCSVYDWSLSREGSDLEQPKTLSEPFCTLRGNTVQLHRPLRRFSVHNQRDRQMGRATEHTGALFRYEALAAGQKFATVVLFDDAADVKALRPLLLGEAQMLGGSHGTGYGLVSFRDVGEPSGNWREIDRPVTDIPAGQPFTATLTSDALIRDENGQYTTSPTESTLAQMMGVGSVTILDMFKRPGVIGGFNRKWGLPLPQTPVVRAGSVFVLQAAAPIPAGVVSGMEARGIGERRAEGLGRVVVNWHGEAERLRLVKVEPRPIPQPPETLVEESLAVARQMTKRLFEKQVDGKLTDYINRLDFRTRGITPSQLNRLRAILRSARAGQAMGRPLEWLNNLRPTAHRQFESARLGDERLLDWLRERFMNPDSVWTEIGRSELPQIGSATVDLGEDLAQEVMIRLVDGVLARLAKEAKRYG